jgi:hypothetical protein
MLWSYFDHDGSGHDGFHIKGIIINFFEFCFPDLLKVEGFIQVTPSSFNIYYYVDKK